MQRAGFLALLVPLWSLSADAAPPDGSHSAPVQQGPPPRPAALDAALGTPPAQGAFGPNTNADPGFVEGGQAPAADQTFGSTARSTAPDGSLVQGHQILDPSLTEDQGLARDVPDYHVVQRGDTLWDISSLYFGDPYAWPKLWSFNEHITNAHWIFPGDRVRLFDPFRDGPRGRGAGGDEPLRLSKTKIPETAKQETFVLNQTAFVDKEKFESAMKVVGGHEAKVMMASLDTLYMEYDDKHPPIPGERLVVYAPQEKVKNLKGKLVGYIVQVMGEVDVETVAPKTAEGTVSYAVNPIERGYRVGPLRRRFKRVDAVDPDKSLHGRIVATLTSVGPMPFRTRKRRKLIGDYILSGDEQFVVVDLGKEDKLVVGNVLEVVRKGDEYTKKRVFKVPYEEGWPRRVTGAVLVVEVREGFALGVVTYARREIERGDHVELRGSDVGPHDEIDEKDPPRRERRKRDRARAKGSAKGSRGGGKASGSAGGSIGN